MPNPNSAADVLAFIKTDPLHIGLATIIANNPGQDTPILNAVNSTTGPGSGTKPGSPITSATLLDLIDGAEYNTMTSVQYDALNPITSAGTVNVGSAPTQTKLNGIFANYAKSLAAIQAKYTAPASPWELYFGLGQVATVTEIDAARNYPPNNPNF